MRISDWSSDVCSSDRWLRNVFGDRAHLAVELHREDDDAARLARLIALAGELQLVPLAAGDVHMATRRQRVLQDTVTAIRHGLPLRSEEHTSELQSLMRISYAVFCLKQKKKRLQ